jgi:hypothetical protein
MFHSISETIFGSQTSSPQKNPNVNMTPRAGKRISGKTKENETPESRIIDQLNNEAKIKDAAILALTAKNDRLEDEKRSAEFSSGIKRRYHPISTISNIIGDSGRQRVKVGTRGSILTTNILQALNEPKKTNAEIIAERFVKVFQNPVEHITYLQSTSFATDLIQVCNSVSEILEKQPRCLFMQSPVYVFGDIHGNLEDLHFFSDNLWKLGMDLTAGQFLFLGDYVDRGMSCLECVAYLFGLKLLFPQKIHLLRGNHETRDVCFVSFPFIITFY